MMDDEWSFFLGFGSMHDLRDSEPERPRLAGMRSVKTPDVRIVARQPQPARRIGFHLPSRTR